MRTDETLQQLLTEILKDFVNELQRVSISIYFVKLKDAYFEMYYINKFKFWIAVSDEFKDESIDSDVLIGGIVHEVCHVVFSKEQSLFYHFMSIISTHYRKLQESHLDIMAINKMYFNHIMSLAKYIKKDLEGDTWDADMGMSPHQLSDLKEKISGKRTT